MNGCLTGLVAVTAGCATVETWVAVVIGIFAGWFYLIASALLIRFKIDDAVDAIPVHMVGGAWGLISTGLLTTPELRMSAFGSDDHVGWFYEWARGSGNFTLIGIQLLAVLFILGWTGVVMGVYFFALNSLGWLRIDPLEEEVGMDLSRHKGSAYDTSGAAKVEHVEDLSTRRGSELGDSSSRRGKSLKKSKKHVQSEEPETSVADDEVPETAAVETPSA